MPFLFPSENSFSEGKNFPPGKKIFRQEKKCPSRKKIFPSGKTATQTPKLIYKTHPLPIFPHFFQYNH
jgi:hypothetical protein